MLSGSESGGTSGSFFLTSEHESVGEAGAETDVGLEVEARAEEGVVVVEEEEARGAGVGDDSRACFLRLRQGLSSEAESLRRRFVRARACSGGADTKADADEDADGASASNSGRGVGVGRFAPAVGGGDSISRCRFSGEGEESGELRGDDAGYSSCGELGGVPSSSGVSVDDAAREYGGGTTVVFWSAISGSGLPDSGVISAARAADGDEAADTGLSGRFPRVGGASSGSSGTGNGV